MSDDVDPVAARRALAESKVRSLSTDIVVADARRQLEAVRADRENNHYRDKIRAILRGVA